MLDVFHTLAEVSVAVTGFSSLIIIFRGSSSPWSRQDLVSFGFVLCWSIGSIFLALMPIILVDFGITLASASRIGMFCAIGYIAVAGTLLTRAQYVTSRAGGGRVNERWRVAMTLLFVVIVATACAGSLQALPGPLNGWYATVIVLLLASATANLGVFVVHGTTQGAAD